MTREEPIYWRTPAGLRAWTCAGSGLPQHYRSILGAIDGPSTVAAIHKAMSACPEKQLVAWLEELDTLGFVQTGRGALAYYPKAA